MKNEEFILVLYSSFFIYHTTPLALWRGVGGEAFILHLLSCHFLNGFIHLVACGTARTRICIIIRIGGSA